MIWSLHSGVGKLVVKVCIGFSLVIYEQEESNPADHRAFGDSLKLTCMEQVFRLEKTAEFWLSMTPSSSLETSP